MYGEEHYAEQEAAATKLLSLNEEFDYAWPPHIIYGVWAELRARWCEELRMTRQKLLHLLGDEAATFERIRFVCTSPDEAGKPWLSMPRTFRLDEPDQYFITDIKVRHEHKLDRAAWNAAF